MLKNIQNFKFAPKHFPTAFLLISFAAYGLLIPFTGFYWDDWPFAWSAHFLGPAEFFPSFAPFRPFLAPIFYLTTSLLPENPVVWQVFGVFIRCLSALTLWLFLDVVWPKHKRQTITASLLFLVFPGYSQGWVAFTHINQELIPLIFLHLSFWFTARALRQPASYWKFISYGLVFQVLGLFPTEYFFTLEFVRFCFILVIVTEQTLGFWNQIKRAAIIWLPHLAIWLVNVGWLFYYYNYGAYASYQLESISENGSLGFTFSHLVSSLADAFFKAGLYSWVQAIKHLAELFPSPTALLTCGLIVVTFSCSIFFFSRLESPSAKQSILKSLLLIGFLAIIIGRLPSWAAGLPLTLQSSYDRFMISMMLGGALFVTGLLELILNSRARAIATSTMIALAIGQQFINANIFRRDWEAQREFYWQMAWRVPALEPNTIIFTSEMPLDYETDLSFTAPLNWIYAPHFQRGEPLPYAMLYTEKRLGGGILQNLEPETEILIPYRTVTFLGTPSKSITIYMPRNGCLRVLDPVYSNEDVYKNQPSSLTSTIHLSDPSRIFTDAPTPAMPRELFGAEPEHTWCYYYVKAELARQDADWEKIILLYEEANALGYAAQDALETLPFIEAFAQAGELETAIKMSDTALKDNPRLRVGLCSLWQRVPLGEESKSFLSGHDCST